MIVLNIFKWVLIIVGGAIAVPLGIALAFLLLCLAFLVGMYLLLGIYYIVVILVHLVVAWFLQLYKKLSKQGGPHGSGSVPKSIRTTGQTLPEERD